MSRDGIRLTREAGFNVAAIVLAAAVSLATTVGQASALEPYGGATAAVLVASSISLWWRRRAPVMVAWVAAAPTLVLSIMELFESTALVRSDVSLSWIPWWSPTAPFAAYSAMAYATSRRAALSAGVILIGATTLMYGSSLSGAGELAARSLTFIVGAGLLGLYLAARRRLLDALLERAERAEREQHLLADQARAEERVRLADEMHDVITHRVSLMVVQAGAVRMTSGDQAVQAAAEELRATGCQALEELRDIVGLLRSTVSNGGGGGETTTQPIALPIDQPVAESAAAGVPVELVEEGDRSLVSPVVGRTAHRIVQEALTNVRKHAPGAEVRVLVRYRPDGVHLVVHNTPPTRPVDDMLVAAGSGNGLFGLRQRVELVNGTLDAGPDPAGGFRVEARLPTYVATAMSMEPTT